jgi:glutamine amidotransferase
MITVIHHELGNIGSVIRALNFLRIDYQLTQDLREIENAKKLILPGVGSFSAAAKGFMSARFREVIRHSVIEKSTPIFGFCLGMQLLADFGEEMGCNAGLGLVSGRVIKLRVNPSIFPVPHMGWNDVSTLGLKMFDGVQDGSSYYFVHSYEFVIDDPKTKQAFVNYGERQICAALEKGTIWGTQFHPEKSQTVGLQILRNFEKL